MFNASYHSLNFSIPPHPRGYVWWKTIDTSAPSPRDILCEPPYLGALPSNTCLLAPRSLVLLAAPRSLPSR
jgi:hypothetical protein